MVTPRVTDGWPLEAFVGDTFTCTLSGSGLGQVTDARVGPVGKGISFSITPISDTALSLTVTVAATTYPGEKRVELISAAGVSNVLPFLVML